MKHYFMSKEFIASQVYIFEGCHALLHRTHTSVDAINQEFT